MCSRNVPLSVWRSLYIIIVSKSRILSAFVRDNLMQEQVMIIFGKLYVLWQVVLPLSTYVTDVLTVTMGVTKLMIFVGRTGKLPNYTYQYHSYKVIGFRGYL